MSLKKEVNIIMARKKLLTLALNNSKKENIAQLIEKIKGSKVNPKIENWVNGVGFILLIILMIIVTYNDILNLF